MIGSGFSIKRTSEDRVLSAVCLTIPSDCGDNWRSGEPPAPAASTQSSRV